MNRRQICTVHFTCTNFIDSIIFHVLTPLSFGHLPAGENPPNTIFAKFSFPIAKSQSLLIISLYSKFSSLFSFVPLLKGGFIFTFYFSLFTFHSFVHPISHGFKHFSFYRFIV